MRMPYYAGLVATLGLVGIALGMPAPVMAVGVGKMCDGIAGIPCNKGLFCDDGPGQCRGADISGTCVRIPEVCMTRFTGRCAVATTAPTATIASAARPGCRRSTTWPCGR